MRVGCARGRLDRCLVTSDLSHLALAVGGVRSRRGERGAVGVGALREEGEWAETGGSAASRVCFVGGGRLAV